MVAQGRATRAEGVQVHGPRAVRLDLLTIAYEVVEKGIETLF